MSNLHSGNMIPEITREEHDGANNAKRVNVVAGDITIAEFPTAAALADATTNPTTTLVGSMLHGFNGTTWDRLRTTNTGQLLTTLVNTTGTAFVSIGSGSDALGTSATLMGVGAYNLGYNGTSWDRLRTNVDSGTTGILFTVGGVWDTTSSAVLRLRSPRSMVDADPLAYAMAAGNYSFNGASWDRVRSGAFTAATSATGVLDSLNLAVYNSTLPTFTTGQYGHMQMGSRGALNVQLMTADGTEGSQLAAQSADAVSTAAVGLRTNSTLYGYNGTTWDRVRTTSSVGANLTGVGLPAVVGHLFAASGVYGVPIAAGFATDGLAGNNTPYFGGSTYNSSTWDRIRSIINATNSTGTGIQAVGLVAQLDDTSPTAITENQFGNLRMSPARALHTENYYTAGRVTADGQIKASAGFIHTITIAPTTATPTAGLLTVYDSLTETGTIIFSEWVFATTPAHTVTLDVPCGTGIYVGYDAALTNVSCTVSYR